MPRAQSHANMANPTQGKRNTNRIFPKILVSPINLGADQTVWWPRLMVTVRELVGLGVGTALKE